METKLDLNLETIYSKFKNYVSKIVYNRLVGYDESICEDVIQQVWENIIRGFQYYEDIGKLKGFIATITINTINNLFKLSHHYENEISLDEARTIYYEEPLRKITEKDLSENFKNILRKVLNYQELLLIILKYYENLSTEEISEIMNITENNLYVRHHRILNKLRNYLPMKKLYILYGN